MTILSWCKNPEQEAIEQAQNIEKHPCLVGNVCLMPDTHSGYGMPIGGVVALKDAVCPNMTGVDAGCGMHAVKTNLNYENLSKEVLLEIHNKIKERIPVGFDWHTNSQDSLLFEDTRWQTTTICKDNFQRAKYFLGTLGGGNHFIEIQKDENNYIWFMLHSGSRNLGKQVCDYYNKVAVTLCKMWKQDFVADHDLAFLPKGTEEYHDYMEEMNLCLDFALENRKRMAQVIKEIFLGFYPDISFEEDIDIHHNYAQMEHHFGFDVMVHRKGATLARKGVTGIIPGSQGTSSYIVEGLGSEKSLCSCSHGAGRKMSRRKAKENLTVENEVKLMGNIIHDITSVDKLDEAPSAYKNIDVVMEEQKDLVKIRTKLTPLAVVKG